MKVFRDIDGKGERKIRSFLGEAVHLGSFEALESYFLEAICSIIPNENPCWNNWNAEETELRSFVSLDCYQRVFAELHENLLATLPYHPMVQGRGFQESFGDISETPRRISDYTSLSDWASCNPLFHEVYRHVDASHQMAFQFVKLSDRSINITLNRASRDFEDSEVQKCTALGNGLAIVTKGLERHLMLERRIEILTSRLGEISGNDRIEFLTPKETLALGAVFETASITDAAAREGVSRHTFSERLGCVREKLGLQSAAQLRAVLRDFTKEKGN